MANCVTTTRSVLLVLDFTNPCRVDAGAFAPWAPPRSGGRVAPARRYSVRAPTAKRLVVPRGRALPGAKIARPNTTITCEIQHLAKTWLVVPTINHATPAGKTPQKNYYDWRSETPAVLNARRRAWKGAGASLYVGEQGDSGNRSGWWNCLKDAFLKSYRGEFEQRLLEKLRRRAQHPGQ